MTAEHRFNARPRRPFPRSRPLLRAGVGRWRRGGARHRVGRLPARKTGAKIPMRTTLLLAGLAVVIATIVWLVTRTCKEVRIADTIVCAENVDYRRLKPGVEPVDVVRPR